MSDEPPEVEFVIEDDGFDSEADDARGHRGGSGGAGDSDSAGTGETGDTPHDDARGGPPTGRSARALRRRAGLGVAAVLIFALGVAVGTHAHDDIPGDATAAGPSTVGPRLTGTEPAPATTSWSWESVPPTDPRPSPQALSSRLAQASEAQQAQAAQRNHAEANFVNDCGGQVPAVTVTGLTDGVPATPPVTAPVTAPATAPATPPATAASGLRLVAGTDASMVGFTTGRVRALDGVYSPLEPGEFVADYTVFGGKIYAVVQTCDDHGGGKLLVMTPDRHGYGTTSLRVATPDGYLFGGLVTGGNTLWAIASPASTNAGAPSTTLLIRVAGPGTSVVLPQGFVPAAGWKNLVVGTLHPVQADGASSSVVLQVLDTATGAIVHQLDQTIGPFVVGAGWVLWAPPCDGTQRCAVHRYDLATRTDAVVGEGAGLGAETAASWAAVSPDGARIAVFVPKDPDAPAHAVTHGFVMSSPSQYRLVVVTVATGAASPVLGVTFPWEAGAVQFSPDSQWLLIGAPTLAGDRLLAYDSGLRGPYQVATLPGRGGGGMPFAFVPDAS